MNQNGIDEKEIEQYFDRLWPILRSITGNGVRQTHKILSEIIPLHTMEIKSGKNVYDWTIPKEWVVREAYVINPQGKKILDVTKNNLHLISYSQPFQGKVSLAELNSHLVSLPDMPDAVPYSISYYDPKWGFCISDAERQSLPEGEYEVHIDTAFVDGSLTISDCVLPGDSKEEILISTYTCHPSMANNELSGPLVCAFLYRLLAALPRRRYTYRFVFLPETIGSIAYLHKYGRLLKKRMVAGYVITCIGDKGSFTYKRTRSRMSLADRAAEYALEEFSGTRSEFVDMTFDEYIRADLPETGAPRVLNFFPDNGSDERQYCSPAFNLPVGSIMRTMYGKFPEYHTSLDNKEFISFEALKESIEMLYHVCTVLEKNLLLKSKIKACEPKLSRHGLHRGLGAAKLQDSFVSAALWLFNQADGKRDLLTIAKKSKIDLSALYELAQMCLEKKLLKKVPGR